MGARVFISYSHFDEDFKNELIPHLDVLVDAGHIDVWHDRKIDGGDDWTSLIDQQLEKCDVALLLVSQHFMRSKFINSVELRRLIERERSSEVKIVPVILRPCPWRFNKLIGSRNALPRDGRLQRGNQGARAASTVCWAAKTLSLRYRTAEEQLRQGVEDGTERVGQNIAAGRIYSNLDGPEAPFLKRSENHIQPDDGHLLPLRNHLT